jgi:glycerophosphoryl diester phosphodiesterase
MNAREVKMIYLWWILGLIWAYPLKDQHFTVPFITKEREQMLMEKILESGNDNLLRRMALRLLRNFLASAKPLMEHLQKRGVFTSVWVLNSQADFSEARACLGDSLDGVITDCPDSLNLYVK